MDLRFRFSTHCPFNIRRTFFFFFFFARCIILNEKVLVWLTISYQTLFVFSVSVLFSNIYPLIKFMAKKKKKKKKKNCQLLLLSDFLDFLSRRIFLLFFVEFELLTFHNNIIEKISGKKKKKKKDQAEFVEILPRSYLSYRFLHNLHFFFFLHVETSEIIWFFLKTND